MKKTLLFLGSVALFCLGIVFILFVQKDLGAGYSKNPYAVYFEGIKMPSADAKTFQVLFDDYAKDKNTLFHKQLAIKNSDPETFEKMGGKYYRDKNNVYYFHTSISGADTSSFEFLQGEYAKDRTHVYYQGVSFGGIDAETAEVLDEESNLIRDKNGIHKDLSAYASKDDGYGHIGFDKEGRRSFYLYGKYIPDEESGSIVLFTDGYFRAFDRFFYGSIEMPTVDTTKFQVLSGGYAKDEARVFFEGIEMKDVKAEDFGVMDALYAKDGLSVIVNGKRWRDARVDSFQILKDKYVKDDIRVFYWDEPRDRDSFPKIIAEASSKTFSVQGDFYATDTNGVYFEGKKIAEPDPLFHIVDQKRWKAEGNNMLYWGNDAVYTGDNWTVTSGDPFNTCYRPVFEGKKIIHGFYVYDRNYTEKEWLFFVSSPQERQKLPYHMYGRDTKIKLENVTPEMQKKLEKSSKENPVSLEIRKLSFYCEGFPLAEVQESFTDK